MTIITNVFKQLKDNPDDIYLIAEIGINHNGDLGITIRT